MSSHANTLALVERLRSASLAMTRAHDAAVAVPDDTSFADRIEAICEVVAAVLGDAIKLAVDHTGTAATEPPPRFPGPEWLEFLDVRRRTIVAMTNRGFDPDEIVKQLNLMDTNQVEAILITASPTKS